MAILLKTVSILTFTITIVGAPLVTQQPFLLFFKEKVGQVELLFAVSNIVPQTVLIELTLF